MKRVIFVTLVWVGILFTSSPSVADVVSRPTSFVLIVTNNRSTRLSRPDLRYADDDGAKYYETFRMIAPEANVALLTTFDRDTEKLFPDLVPRAKPPSKANVDAVAGDFAARVAVAKAAGPVDFYFVFAGHGDVDNGKGFLELSDGPFTSDDLEALLRSIPATRSHVILDSCNSFFVINARKPGGRHFLTSEEATKSLSERLPNVGVFLSTSAEAEVYEWSELQSGVFSHAVRSGLSGAADANGDGEVSYDELRAFVNTASGAIRNPAYRPQVFARAPRDRGADAIFHLAGADATRLRLDEKEHRLTVRDKDELPWIDAHKEGGATLTLYLPTRVAVGATVDEKRGDGSRVVRSYVLPAQEVPTEALLAALPPSDASAPRIDMRGPDEMFASLYSRPFGARAFAQYEQERATEPPMVLGVSEDDKHRIQNLLEQGADRARVERYTNAFVVAGVGAVVAGVGLGNYDPRSTTWSKIGWGGFAGVGGAVAIGGAVQLFIPSGEEKLYGRYVRGMSGERDAMQLTLKTENALFALAWKERRARIAWRWVDFGLAMLSGACAVEEVFYFPHSPPGEYALFGAGVIGFGSLFGLSFVKSPAEQMADSWSKDPSLKGLPDSRPAFTLTPTIGLGSVGFTGTF